MSAEAEEHRHEIIIVKRHGDHEDGHHGGVWKIAFADFMTAMMCFFLVMWLINAANEQTKAAVASYFNPVKLIDRNSSKKGIEDMGDGANSLGMTGKEPVEPASQGGAAGSGNAGPATQESSEASDTETKTDEALFENPYAVLAEIAAETGIMQNVSAKGDGGAQISGPSTGAAGGEAYRDPFAPDFWSQEVAAFDTASGGGAGTGEAAQEREPADPAEPPAQAAVPPPVPAGASPAAIEAAETIRKALQAAFGPDDALAGGIAVAAGRDGVTVSVTEQLDFGMFEIGSAVPRREMVLAMEKIGKVLAAQPGDVTIGGHTDARPFRSAAYDNWRLSSARAHAAYYMLARGGLAEARIVEVAGHADRRLKDPADPLASVNRRIEILLSVPG